MKADVCKLVCSALLGVICALALLLLDGCQPYLTYDELEAGAEADPKIQKRLERFRHDVERAELFIRGRDFCITNNDCYVHCEWRGIKSDAYRRNFKGVDDLVRWYRAVHMNCSFVSETSW